MEDEHFRDSLALHPELLESFARRGEFPQRYHPLTGGSESILATGFWFLGEWVHSPVDIRQDEADRFENMIDVYSKTFLGLTVACARCHDHKFDPITQKDFYALQGYLQSSAYRQAHFENESHNRPSRACRYSDVGEHKLLSRPGCGDAGHRLAGRLLVGCL
ncbi:MAG: DUF1549 domain-containing protein [Planctomycetaceae bacterium]